MFDLDNLPLPTSPIPLVLVQGHWHTSLTECPCPPPLDSYLKSPAIMLPDGYESTLFIRKASGERMLIEAVMYEILKNPSICQCFGCIMLDDKGHPLIINFDLCEDWARLRWKKEKHLRLERKTRRSRTELHASTMASDEYALSLIAQVDDDGFPFPPGVSFLISPPFHCDDLIRF